MSCSKIVFLVFLFLSIVSNVSAETYLLNKIIPVKNIKLHSIKDKHKFSLPIPARWKVKSATLRFSYINSSALLAYKSRLVVSVDGIPMGQWVLDPENSHRQCELMIPGRMLRPGYHELTFEVAQHSERECEDPFAPELWTLLRLGEAQISFDYVNIPIPLKLSSIPDLIEDPKTIPVKRINFVLKNINKDMLEIAAVVASGMGARLSYRPLQLSVSKDIIRGVDNIFLTTSDRLGSLVSDLPHGNDIKGARIFISHLPTSLAGNSTELDNTHALIVITGETKSQLLKAAKAFASISFQFPQTRSMVIENVEIPELHPLQKKFQLIPGIPVMLHDLGFKTHVFEGMHKEPVGFDFFLPPDLYIKPNQYTVLSLHFGFSGAIRKDSTMQIKLNDKPVASIHLDNEHGAFYENYKLLLPTYLFKPGRNVISFETLLVPLIIKRCEGFQDMNLFLTLFDDSKIAFPSMGHWGKLPEIRYFFDSGFPFSRNINQSELIFLLKSRDIPSITLAMNIAAYIGQLDGIALEDCRFEFDTAKVQDKDVIIIANTSNIPKAYVEKAPLTLINGTAWVKYPQFLDLFQSRNRSIWQKIEEKLESYNRLFPVTGKMITSNIHEQRVGLDLNTGLIMEFESPCASGRSVLLWTAKTTNLFVNTAKLLWSGKLRNTAEGDLVIYKVKPESVHSFKVGPTYYTGKLSKSEKMDFLLRSYPWIIYVILAISFLFLAIIFATYLRWRKKKRMANEI